MKLFLKITEYNVHQMKAEEYISPYFMHWGGGGFVVGGGGKDRVNKLQHF